MLEVEWVDSTVRGGWGTADDYRASKATPAVIRSVGYTLGRNAHALTLVQSRSADVGKEGEMGDAVADSISIPLGCIKRVRRLTGGVR